MLALQHIIREKFDTLTPIEIESNLYVPFLALRRLDASSRILRWDAIRCDLLPPELFTVSDIFTPLKFKIIIIQRNSQRFYVYFSCKISTFGI